MNVNTRRRSTVASTCCMLRCLKARVALAARILRPSKPRIGWMKRVVGLGSASRRQVGRPLRHRRPVGVIIVSMGMDSMLVSIRRRVRPHLPALRRDLARRRRHQLKYIPRVHQVIRIRCMDTATRTDTDTRITPIRIRTPTQVAHIHHQVARMPPGRTRRSACTTTNASARGRTSSVSVNGVTAIASWPKGLREHRLSPPPHLLPPRAKSQAPRRCLALSRACRRRRTCVALQRIAMPNSSLHPDANVSASARIPAKLRQLRETLLLSQPPSSNETCLDRFKYWPAFTTLQTTMSKRAKAA